MNPEDPDEVRRRRLARLAATPPSTNNEAPPPVAAPPKAASPAKPAPAEKKPKPSPPAAAAPSPPAKTPRSPVPVDRLLTRCLRVRVVDGAPKAAGEVFEISKADAGGPLGPATIAKVLEARLRAGAGGDPLGALHDGWVRLRDEARNANSRGDALATVSLAAAGDACSRLAATCLGAPETLGPNASGCRAALAAALSGQHAAFTPRPEFVQAALAPLQPETLAAVAAPLVDACVAELRKPSVGEAEVDRACGALVAWLACAGKKTAGAALRAHAMFAPPPLQRPAQGDANPGQGDGPDPLAAALAAAGIPQQNAPAGPLGGLLRAMAAAARNGGGAAFEQGTLLGLIAKATPQGSDPDDQAGMRELGQAMGNHRGSEAQRQALAGRVSVAREATGRLFEQLVKNGPSTRDAAMEWCAALLNRSEGATAHNVDRRKTPGAPARLAACAALLRLCRPFLGREDREKNARADLLFLGSELGKAAFPDDLTRVNFEFANAASGPTPMEESDDEMYDEDPDDELAAALALSRGAAEPPPPAEFHFVTTCFFLCARALHLGLVAELARLESEERAFGMHAHRMGPDHPRLRGLLAMVVARDAAALVDAQVADALAFSAAECRWLLRLGEDDLRRCPEHVLEDVADLPSHVARRRPDQLRRAPPLGDLLKVAARCLGARDRLVRSPHAREKLAKALYDCFLPAAARPDGRSRDDVSEANATLLMEAEADVATQIAPALLWLFGDAENLGFYDIEPARLRVAALIRHLWTSENWRAAFRTLTADKRAFTTFANGLLNETNKLVASAMEKLPAIRDHQVRTGVQDPGASDELRRLRDEYQSAGEQTREELDERNAEHEEILKKDLRLCTETLGLVELLNDDAGGFREAFASDELRGRVAGMVLSVVRAFTGRRSLDIKVQNPEQYGFDPKDILSRVGRIATHFAKNPSFAAALAESGYYAPDLLPKCVATLRRLRALPDASLDALDNLAAAAASANDAAALDAGLEDEAPPEFVDPLTCELMTSPVKLPSGNVVDDATIQQHLLNETSDPFSRQPLQPEDVVPLPELKARIAAWLTEARAKRRAARG